MVLERKQNVKKKTSFEEYYKVTKQEKLKPLIEKEKKKYVERSKKFAK